MSWLHTYRMQRGKRLDLRVTVLAPKCVGAEMDWACSLELEAAHVNIIDQLTTEARELSEVKGPAVDQGVRSGHQFDERRERIKLNSVYAHVEKLLTVLSEADLAELVFTFRLRAKYRRPGGGFYRPDVCLPPAPPARALQRPQPQTARFHATGASPRQTARAYSDRAPVAAPSAAAAARRNILATERSAPLGGAPAAQPADRRARTPARRARLSAGPERGSRRDPPACAARVPSGRGAAAAAVCVRRAGGVQGLFGAPLAAPTR